MVILQAMFFILLNFIKSIYVFSALREEAFYSNIYYWFALPSDLLTLLYRPWTLLTMMFTEVRMMAVIGNLIWLWTFGHLVQDLIGGNKLFPAYIYSAWAAALVFVLSVNLGLGNQAAGAYFTGVAAGIMGLATVATVVAPQYRFFPMINGGIPLWIIALIYAVLHIAAVSSELPMLFALAAGAAAGYFYAYQLKRGTDMGAWMNGLARRIENLFRPEAEKKNPAQRSSQKQPQKQKQYKEGITQQQVDAILDKISQQGFEKLTEEEKMVLEKASKQDL